METPAVLTVTAEQKHGGNALAASGEARARAKPLQLCPLFATLWTTACQAPLSTDSPGKSTGVGCGGHQGPWRLHFLYPTGQSPWPCPLSWWCPWSFHGPTQPWGLLLFS